VTDAELGILPQDCLRLWAVEGQLAHAVDGWEIVTAVGAFSTARADPELRPVRWFLQTPGFLQTP